MTAAAIGIFGFLYVSFQSDLAVAQHRISEGSHVLNTAYGPMQYADVDHGYPVLFVHGLGSDHALILSQVLLDQNNVRIIAPSMFGFLGTPVPPGASNASLASEADAYSSLLDRLNVTSRVAVIGYSAGGPSSIEFALRHADRTSSLILVSAIVHPIQPPSAMDINNQLHNAMLKSDFLMWLTMKYLQPTFVTFFAVTPALKAGLSAQDNAWVSNVVFPSLLPISEREPGISHHTTDFAQINYSLERIRVPTLIIDAKDDLGPPANAMFSTSPSHSAYAAEKIPNAVHIEYDTGGHLLLGHEREAKSAIMKFIDQNQ